MEIQLTPESEEWLKTQVMGGRFASLDAAVEALITSERTAEAALDSADLEWARPFINEGLADLAAGRTHSADIVHKEILSSLGRETE